MKYLILYYAGESDFEELYAVAVDTSIQTYSQPYSYSELHDLYYGNKIVEKAKIDGYDGVFDCTWDIEPIITFFNEKEK